MEKRHKQLMIRSDVHTAFKTACAKKGTTMAGVLVRLIKEYCDEAGVEIQFRDDKK